MLTSSHMPLVMSAPVVHRVPALPSSAALGVEPVTDEEATQLVRESAVSPELPLEAPLAVPLEEPLLVPLEEPLLVPLAEPLPPPPPELETLNSAMDHQKAAVPV